eukprot:scaffold24.g2934.t1
MQMTAEQLPTQKFFSVDIADKVLANQITTSGQANATEASLRRTQGTALLLPFSARLHASHNPCREALQPRPPRPRLLKATQDLRNLALIFPASASGAPKMDHHLEFVVWGVAPEEGFGAGFMVVRNGSDGPIVAVKDLVGWVVNSVLMFSDNEPAVSMIGFLCTETASLTLHHINAGKDNKDMPYLTYLTTASGRRSGLQALAASMGYATREGRQSARRSLPRSAVLMTARRAACLLQGQYQKANTSVDASLTEIGKWRAANSTEAHS